MHQHFGAFAFSAYYLRFIHKVLDEIEAAASFGEWRWEIAADCLAVEAAAIVLNLYDQVGALYPVADIDPSF